MEDLYKQYFNSMPCYISVQDRDLNILNANERFKEHFGEFEGRYCYQVYKQRPEKCEECPVERTFRTGQPYHSEELVRTLDGREVAVLVNTMPIRNGSGEITSVMEMSTDVTEMKQLQTQLRSSQERYRLLFEEVPCYISIQDQDLRILNTNRYFREAFGSSYGKKCYEVYKHRDQECFPCTVRQTFTDGQHRIHEEVVTSKDNKRINVQVHTAPLKNADGVIDRVIEMSADITKIRQLQDKLTSIGLLIGSISHTIKGLLNGLDGGIYLVNTGLKNDNKDRVDKGWNIALRNIDRIRTMVLNILYYAKDRELHWADTPIDQFTTDVCTIMQEKAKGLGIEFTYDIPENPGDFEIDQHSMRSVMVNLLENAFDACRTDVKECCHYVNVSVTGDDETVEFHVKDNGIGMDRETREKAFSLFFSSKGAGGTGLGMFIADKIVLSHGGQITIESEQGKGTEVTVRIPRAKPDVLETTKIEI